jgi:4Fe-4S ferredoxin
MKATVIKEKGPGEIRLSLPLYHQSVSLTLDRELCFVCEICSLVCPRDAIRVFSEDGELDIDIDRTKCLMCELCSYFCPVSAIKLEFNLAPKSLFEESDAVSPPPGGPLLDPTRCSYGCPPVRGREPHWCRSDREWVEGAAEDCPKSCLTCLKGCTREAFRVEGIEVAVDPDICLHCLACHEGCPQEAVRVEPYFLGSVTIRSELCPDDCSLCIDACPTKAIERTEGRVEVARKSCLYCGACRVACTYDLIDVERDWVFGESASFSAAWDDAAARLKGSVRAREERDGL